ncbi:MAG TPA: UvrB/UvrC motif-containing protein [Longimicrobiales bacterium]|nr:UvrB/UvrC motif-containing protein [Longimicrobiales bacterium]
MQPLTRLREHVRGVAENRPGVYRMYGAGGELLYVGKSVRVRARLLSYFRAPRGDKAWELIRDTARVEWEYIPNEFYALITEMKLIQRWQPRYNVQHRRRRIYTFVKVTREPAPRVLPVTRVSEDGATYYGPFPRVQAVARIIRELAHVLGLRDCPATTPVLYGDQIELFEGGRAPRCIRADLRSCLAPCCGRVPAADYMRAVDLARRFLEGRADAPLAELERQMDEAAARLDFEYAALLRDRIERLREFRDELVAFRGRVEDLTFLYRVPGFGNDDRIYLIRRGRIRRELPYPKGRRARAAVARAVEQVYGEPELGPGGLEAQDAAEILLVARWFRTRPEERRRTVTPERWLEGEVRSRAGTRRRTRASRSRRTRTPRS